MLKSTGNRESFSATRRRIVQSASHSAVAETTTTITVYVRTCQFPPKERTSISKISSASILPDEEKWKADVFPVKVAPTATLTVIQSYLASQWQISKSPYAEIPQEEHFYTYKGRIMRLDSAFDSYYIGNEDRIYLRFASMGKILDPWAMSTSELRQELKLRDAYIPKLQPEQLMQRLQDEIRRESRLERLAKATRLEEEEAVQTITKEVVSTKQSVVLSASTTVARPVSLKWPFAPCPNRTVFLSITALERIYQQVPRDVLEPALFLFDTERKWVFDTHNILQKQQFDYRYMSFDQDFLELLLSKEEAGMVFWFRPHKSYEKLSSFLCGFKDPVTLKPFNPLTLKETKWLTLAGINGWEGKKRVDGRKKDASKTPKFTKSIVRITSNIASRSFEYLAVQELLYQANPTLLFAPL